MKKCYSCEAEKPLDQFYAKQRICKTCHNAKSAAYRQENKSKLADYMTKYREANRDKILSYDRNSKQQRATKNSNYYRINKKKWAAYSAKRRAQKSQATPSWADVKRVQSYYDVAAFFNEVNGYVKYHVDHIVPLRGKKVCGLHVHTNLRIIFAAENLSKKNYFEI